MRHPAFHPHRSGTPCRPWPEAPTGAPPVPASRHTCMASAARSVQEAPGALSRSWAPAAATNEKRRAVCGVLQAENAQAMREEPSRHRLRPVANYLQAPQPCEGRKKMCSRYLSSALPWRNQRRQTPASRQGPQAGASFLSVHACPSSILLRLLQATHAVTMSALWSVWAKEVVVGRRLKIAESLQ